MNPKTIEVDHTKKEVKEDIKESEYEHEVFGNSSTNLREDL